MLAEELLLNANQGAVAQIRRGYTDGLLNFAYACMHAQASICTVRLGIHVPVPENLVPTHPDSRLIVRTLLIAITSSKREQRSIASLPAGTWRL